MVTCRRLPSTSILSACCQPAVCYSGVGTSARAGNVWLRRYCCNAVAGDLLRYLGSSTMATQPHVWEAVGSIRSSALLSDWSSMEHTGELSDRHESAKQGTVHYFNYIPSSASFFSTADSLLRTQVLFATLRVVGKTLQTLSGSTTSMAALSDCASGDRLTFWSAWLGSAACVGVIMGGWIETIILALRGQGATQTVYFTMAAMGAVHTTMVALLLQETLPAEERKSDPPRFQSPLGMFKLFSNGRSLRLAALSCTWVVDITTLVLVFARTRAKSSLTDDAVQLCMLCRRV